MKNPGIATVTLCAGLLAGLAADAAAQEVVPRPPAASQEQVCPEGQAVRGDLGISGLECNCSYYIGEAGERIWRFRSEPVIVGVREGGPADGKLRAGDAINAIDGMLITTREAGRHYANLEPGDRVTLTVRRGERLARVPIDVGAQCERVVEAADAWQVLVEPTEVIVAPEPVVGAVEVEPEPAGAVEVEPEAVEAEAAVDVEPVVLVAPHVSLLARPLFPGGWFGFGISCNCSVHRGGPGKPPVWKFNELPEVFSVEPGSPADRAGLQRGDVLVEIDGISLTDDEGGRRFGAVTAGQTVTFKYRRGGATRQVTITAVEREIAAPPVREEATREVMREIERQQARQQEIVERMIAEAERASREQERELAELLAQRIELPDSARRLQERDLAELLAQRVEQADSARRLQERELAEMLAQGMEQQRAAQRQLEAMLRDRAPADVPAPDRLRFTGTVGNVDVEVRGGSSVITTIIEEGREIVIVTRDARIRIRRKN